MRLIGLSRVASQHKITLIEQVAKILNVKIGDDVAFFVSDTGQVMITNKNKIEYPGDEKDV